MELSEQGRAIDARDLQDSPKEPPYLMKVVRRMEMHNDELEEILNSIANRLTAIDASVYPQNEGVLDKPEKEPMRSFHSDMLTKLDKYSGLINRAVKINEGLKRLVG